MMDSQDCNSDGVCLARDIQDERRSSENKDEGPSSSRHHSDSQSNDASLNHQQSQENNETAAQTQSTTPSEKKEKKTKPNLSVIRTIPSQKELDILINTHAAVLVEFMTSWCGACKSIASLYEELALSVLRDANTIPPQPTGASVVQCAKVLCDKNKETKKMAANYNIQSYPVFILWEEGQQVQTWKGADPGKLEKAMERLVDIASMDGDGGGGRKRGGGKKKGKKR